MIACNNRIICNFQVIQLDSRSPQNIEMSEEKIICLIAPFALLHNIFQTIWNGIQNLYWSGLNLLYPKPKNNQF